MLRICAAGAVPITKPPPIAPAASEEVQDDLVGQLQEAASDLYKAHLRLQANDPGGALDDAAEALEELAKAQKRLEQSSQ